MATAIAATSTSNAAAIAAAIQWQSDVIKWQSDTIKWQSDAIKWPSDAIKGPSDAIKGPSVALTCFEMRGLSESLAALTAKNAALERERNELRDKLSKQVRATDG